MNQKSLFISAVFALLAVFIGGALWYVTSQEKAAEERALAQRESLIRQHSPTLGPPHAPVTIVEFLDPACETCRAFYPLVKEIMAAHPDHVRLVLRYAPFHQGSDQVVAALEAARRQGKFWQALEVLLVTQADWAPHHQPQVALTWKHLEKLGLNMEQLAFDVTDPKITSLIQQDLADAASLEVSKTPSFFVNGKPLVRFGAEELKALVKDEVAKTAAR